MDYHLSGSTVNRFLFAIVSLSLGRKWCARCWAEGDNHCFWLDSCSYSPGCCWMPLLLPPVLPSESEGPPEPFPQNCCPATQLLASVTAAYNSPSWVCVEDVCKRCFLLSPLTMKFQNVSD